MNDVTTEQERRAQIARLAKEPASRQQILVTIEASHSWFTKHTMVTLAREIREFIPRCLAEPDKVTVKATPLN